ncbi:MAG: hypothetical protein LBT03_01325 [Holosporales bacterium]|jgi:hypothetical protein|nr:hypothetical protein [Holosporales bacterium]
MLRNNFKISLCGLIPCVVFLDGCSDTRPLIGKEAQAQKSNSIKIIADPYVEYKIRDTLETSLCSYEICIDDYRIYITINENDSSVVFTERQVAKEQLRMTAKVELCDKDYNKLAEKSVDTYSTYEVCDDIPYSALASRKQAIDAVLYELGNSITLVIVSCINTK